MRLSLAVSMATDPIQVRIHLVQSNLSPAVCAGESHLRVVVLKTQGADKQCLQFANLFGHRSLDLRATILQTIQASSVARGQHGLETEPRKAVPPASVPIIQVLL